VDVVVAAIIIGNIVIYKIVLAKTVIIKIELSDDDIVVKLKVIILEAASLAIEWI